MTTALEGNAATKEIVVNGDTVVVSATTMATLVDELGYGEQKVATALNGDFVPARARGGTPVTAGDRIEIVSPRQGG